MTALSIDNLEVSFQRRGRSFAAVRGVSFLRTLTGSSV